MTWFVDEPIPGDLYFVNAPSCRTCREAARQVTKNKALQEPHPHLNSNEKILHTITALDRDVINRRVVCQVDDAIRKSVRIAHSNLEAEGNTLELIQDNTSVPVPKLYSYHKSKEFEHLVMEQMSGEALAEVGQSMDTHCKEKIADEVVELLRQVRMLKNTQISAALLDRKPFPSGVLNAKDFMLERFRQLPKNEHISAYVEVRAALLSERPIVFSHCDLDPTNIIIDGMKVSGIIDWESSGYFPDFWEWLILKRQGHNAKPNMWPNLLAARLEEPDWDVVWELEQLHMALTRYASESNTPDSRSANRKSAWEKVTKILGITDENPPYVHYKAAHPFWQERKSMMEKKKAVK